MRGYIVASAQQWPASSRATATATIVRRLPRRSSACQRWCRRRALWSARARTAAGWPWRRRSSVALARSGRRWCQAASTSSRRACVLPVLVIAPRRRRSPVESSLGVRPRNGPSDCGRKRVQSPISTVSAERGQRRDATQTAEPADDLGERRLRGELGDRLRRARRGASSPAAPRRSTRRTRARAAGSRTAAGAATRRGRASRRSRRRPARAATAASRAGAGPASDHPAHPRAHAPDRAPPPRAAPAPAPRPAHPAASSRASRSASRRSVFTRSPGARGIFDGAATVHAIPAAAQARASPYPVGPASYATRTGAGNRSQPLDRLRRHAPAPAASATHRSPASNTPATTLRACTSSPTQRTLSHTGASRNCGSTAAPLATATRANLRARRRALHTV